MGKWHGSHPADHEAEASVHGHGDFRKLRAANGLTCCVCLMLTEGMLTPHRECQASLGSGHCSSTDREPGRIGATENDTPPDVPLAATVRSQVGTAMEWLPPACPRCAFYTPASWISLPTDCTSYPGGCLCLWLPHLPRNCKDAQKLRNKVVFMDGR